MIPYLRALLHRELRTLRREVDAYPDDASPWRSAPTVPNTGGTLVLHLSGNLRHFVGAVLGGTGYVRDREAEFSRRGLTRAELVAEIDAAMADVDAGFARLTDADLTLPYPVPVGPVRLATSDFLLHLAVHLGYHLGQVDYHRRAVAGDPRSVGAMALGELGSAVPA